MLRHALIVLMLAACSKSPAQKTEKTDKKDVGSAGSGSAASQPAEPTEVAEVVGPTKSATGSLAISGAISGTFEWKKKDQRAPITCIWDPDKEIGSLKIDVSDGAGHIVTVGIDIPPSDAGPGRLEVRSKDLPVTLTTYAGFKLKGDAADQFSAVFDNAVAVTHPTEQEQAAGSVTLKGTLDVTCPKKK